MKKFTEILIISGALIFLGVTIFFHSNNSSNVSGVTLVRVPQGGTGWGNIQANTVLYGNGTGKIATTTGSTNGYVLSLVSGVPTFVASSSGSGAPFAWTPTADGNSTSTRLIFGNGFISQASSTFSGTGTTTFSKDIDVRQLQVTGSEIYGDTDVSHLILSSVSGTHLGYHNGGGENTLVITGGVAQFTLNGNEIGRFNSSGFGIFDTSPTYPLDVTGAGHFTSLVDASHFIATSTTLESSFPKFTATNSTTTSFSIGGLFNIGGDYLNELCGTGLTCTGNALASSLGVSVDISGETNLAVTWPVILTGDILSFGGLSTSTAAVIGNIPYFSGVNTFDNVATTSVTIGTGLSYSGTFGSVIGGAAGSLTLNATGDWTGTIDSNNFAGGAIGAGELIYGGSAGSFSELLVSTNGFVLALSGGIPAWVASTTLSTISGTLDISAQSNLAVTAPITLTGDTLSLGDVSVYPAFTYATSTTWTGTTTIPLGPAYVAETWNGGKCFTDVGTLNVVFSDGTNLMDLLNASTTVGTFTLSTNNSFISGEKRYVDVGTPVSSPTKISCTLKKTLSIN